MTSSNERIFNDGAIDHTDVLYNSQVPNTVAMGAIRIYVDGWDSEMYFLCGECDEHSEGALLKDLGIEGSGGAYTCNGRDAYVNYEDVYARRDGDTIALLNKTLKNLTPN